MFPKGKHDDQVDSTAQFLGLVQAPVPGQGISEYYRQLSEEAEQRRKPKPAPPNPAPGSHGMARRTEKIELNRVPAPS